MVKVKTLVRIALILGVSAVGLYLLLKQLVNNGKIAPESFWSVYKNYVQYIGLGLLGVVIVVYVIDWVLSHQKEKALKEYVEPNDAIEIWKTNFIKNTYIPHYFDYNQKDFFTNKSGKLTTASPYDIDIHDKWSFSDPQTGIPAVGFVVEAKSGIRRGLNFFIIRLDKGKQWINNNWDCNVKEHKFWEILEVDRKYPMFTPQEENSRLNYQKIDALKEGSLTEKEAQYLDNIKVQEKKTQEDDSKEDTKKQIEELKKALQKNKANTDEA